MKYKSAPPIHTLIKEDVPPLVQLFYEFNALKQLYRQGWLQRGIPEAQCESVAEHILGVALMAYFVAEAYFPELNVEKIIKIALLHDFGEIYAGDMTPGDGVPAQKKHQAEEAAIHKIFHRFPNGAEYIRLWEEYENGSSGEAKLVKQIDRLEMALQASVYGHMGHGSLQEFFDSTARSLEAPELLDLFDNIREFRR